MTATDKLGQEIKEGHYIAYGHAMGRCAGLRIGRVHKIKHLPKDQSVMRQPELCKRMGTLMFPDRIIVLDVRNVPETHLALLSDSTD